MKDTRTNLTTVKIEPKRKFQLRYITHYGQHW